MGSLRCVLVMGSVALNNIILTSLMAVALFRLCMWCLWFSLSSVQGLDKVEWKGMEKKWRKQELNYTSIVYACLSPSPLEKEQVCVDCVRSHKSSMRDPVLLC